MTGIILPHRHFFTGLAALIAAPAVVRAASLMPVSVLIEETTAVHAGDNRPLQAIQEAIILHAQEILEDGSLGEPLVDDEGRSPQTPVPLRLKAVRRGRRR